MSQVPPFIVDPDMVREIQDLIQRMAARSSYTTLNVDPNEFPAWLVALGKPDFHAQVTRGGQKFVRAGYAIIGDDTSGDAPMMSVTCATPPAPWVSFPDSEGDRRYMFRYTMNVLQDKESK